MPNAFDSPRRKIDWAQHHLAKVKRIVIRFHRQPGLYEPFGEQHPDIPERIVYKVRLTRKPPWFLDDVVADVVVNLRAALDHAVFASSCAAGETRKDRHATFPFGRTEKDFRNSLRRNCRDIPSQIRTLIEGYKPYKGGEAALWALHAVRCANEHALVTPVGSAVYVGQAGFQSTGGFASMPYRPVWDKTKNEMELYTLGPGANLNGDFKLASTIEFNEIESVAGQSVVPTLELFVDMVTTIVGEIEAETRKFGFAADLR